MRTSTLVAAESRNIHSCTAQTAAMNRNDVCSADPVTQEDLFAVAPALPAGFSYQAEFLSRSQETELLRLIQALPFKEARYKQWDAKRRIVSFGGSYDFTGNELLPSPEIPSFLYPLREQSGRWASVPVAQLNHAMIAEYRPGTPLGWHRDVPQFETVIGISLAGTARMRLRPYPPVKGRRATRALEITPRSIYAMRGAVRWEWQHAISATRDLRYSITFRSRGPDSSGSGS